MLIKTTKFSYSRDRLDLLATDYNHIYLL